MRFNKYTKDKLIEAVASSVSIRQVLLKLDVVPHGGNYRVVKNYIEKLSIDTSHFLGQSIRKGAIIGPKRDIKSYLSNRYAIASHTLRKRLIQEKFFEPKCYHCGLDTWNNLPIPLELEHKDGNHLNNNLDNLTLLCPNCHAQTTTYRGRNIKTNNAKHSCLDCGTKISKRSKRCKSCAATERQKTTLKRPSKKDLLNDIQIMSFCAIGRKYNVSDNTVRKWCKFYQISK